MCSGLFYVVSYWKINILAEADERGEDIETHVPIDREGLKMTRLLSQYSQEKLPDIIKEEEKKKEFTIYTSPIKRAKNMANIISKNLKLAHTENPEVPIPKTNIPEELENGSDTGKPIISPKVGTGDAVTIKENECYISGFDIRNPLASGNKSGIYLEDSSYTMIRDINITESPQGIHLYNTANNIIHEVLRN